MKEKSTNHYFQIQEKNQKQNAGGEEVPYWIMLKTISRKTQTPWFITIKSKEMKTYNQMGNPLFYQASKREKRKGVNKENLCFLAFWFSQLPNRKT